eukprot:CAMPEP_0114117428 /NCGR_PEP_ID=MMETSP0043_2-20121206/5028_1 /TAXON_ID=464988 /ORGANISM="Hemiselmis andersenii, Strain CCMP644" /LENGTH=176 /DNA_ID=CAMNT_0001209819 /DNA_START=30 /DNA_END=563 /DNA_ORIENTATION=-
MREQPVFAGLGASDPGILIPERNERPSSSRSTHKKSLQVKHNSIGSSAELAHDAIPAFRALGEPLSESLVPPPDPNLNDEPLEPDALGLNKALSPRPPDDIALMPAIGVYLAGGGHGRRCGGGVTPVVPKVFPKGVEVPPEEDPVARKGDLWLDELCNVLLRQLTEHVEGVDALSR